MADLEAAADYINQNFRGWEMEAVRNEIAQRVQQERNEYDRLMRSVEQLYSQGALSRRRRGRRPFTWKARPTWSVTEQDKERLRQLLATLEEKQRIVDLLVGLS